MSVFYVTFIHPLRVFSQEVDMQVPCPFKHRFILWCVCWGGIMTCALEVRRFAGIGFLFATWILGSLRFSGTDAGAVSQPPFAHF